MRLAALRLAAGDLRGPGPRHRQARRQGCGPPVDDRRLPFCAEDAAHPLRHWRRHRARTALSRHRRARRAPARPHPARAHRRGPWQGDLCARALLPPGRAGGAPRDRAQPAPAAHAWGPQDARPRPAALHRRAGGGAGEGPRAGALRGALRFAHLRGGRPSGCLVQCRQGGSRAMSHRVRTRVARPDRVRSPPPFGG